MDHHAFFINHSVLPALFRLIIVTFLLLLTTFLQEPLAQDSGPTISLSEEERTWLENNSEVTLGYTDSQEPQLIVNSDGSYSGVVVDLLDELNRRLGTSFKLAAFPVKELFLQAKSKKIDGILNLNPSYAERLKMLKSIGYFKNFPSIFARRDLVFNGPEDIPGKTVAIIDKLYFSEKIIKEYEGQVTIKRVKSALEGLQSLQNGEADIFIGVSHNSYFISKYQLYDVAVKYIYTDYKEKMVIAVRPDWPVLVSILNKGLSSFTNNELKQIVVKWVQLPELEPGINLTAEERTWLAQEHVVKVRVVDRPPYIYLFKGKPVGLAVDLIDEVSRRTGIQFHYVVPSPSFKEDLEGLIQHEGPDLILTITPTQEREKLILFTKAYASSPKFIFTREDTPFITSLEVLNDKTVAVVDGFIVHDILARDYPNIELLVFKSGKEALSAVSSGRAFAFIDSLFTTPSMINQFGFHNLKANAPASSFPESVANMGIRNDWPELLDIFNNVFDTLPPEKMAAIVNKWTTVKFDHGIVLFDILKWVLGVVGVAIVIILLFVIWNVQLRRTVRIRTADLEAEIVERRLMEDALRDSEKKFRALVEQSPLSIQIFNPDGKIIKVNNAWMEMWGIPDDALSEVIDKYCLFSDNKARALGIMPLVEKAFNGEDVEIPILEYDAESTMQQLQVTNALATKKMVQLYLYPIKNSQGKVTNVVGVEEDLTEKKQAEDDLRRSHAYLEHVTGTMSDAIFSVKMPERIIEWANDSYSVLGYELEEYIGQLVDKFYGSPEEYKAVGALMKNAIESGEQMVHTETQLRRKNGEVFPAEISITIYRENGKVVSNTSLVRDITDRKLAEKKIEQYQERLKAMASQLTVVEEVERRRIAAGIHDHIGQILAFSRIQLAKAKKQATEQAQVALLDDISQSMLQVIEDTRTLIFDLSSPLLNELGLDAALSDWLENQVKGGYGIDYSFDQEGLDVELSDLEKTILFRNFKEMVVNAVKHAQASRIDVRLRGGKKQLLLVVTDNGIGFNPELDEVKTKSEGGFGLFSIQERMADINGKFTITSETGKGTSATLMIPVHLEAI